MKKRLWFLYVTAQAQSATCSQPRASASPKACALAMCHSPTALLKKYRGASNNQSKSWLSQSLQDSRTLSNIRSWHFHQLGKLNRFLMWFARQIYVDFHSLHPKALKKAHTNILILMLNFSPLHWVLHFLLPTWGIKMFPIELLKTPPHTVHMKQTAQVEHHCNCHWIDYPFR